MSFTLHPGHVQAYYCGRAPLPPVLPSSVCQRPLQTHGGARKKRPLTRKEPRIEEYGSPAEFEQAWLAWRKARDENNRSVREAGGEGR